MVLRGGGEGGGGEERERGRTERQANSGGRTGERGRGRGGGGHAYTSIRTDMATHAHTQARSCTHTHKSTHTKGGWGSEWVRRPTRRGGIVRLGAQPNEGSAVLSVSALDQSVPLVIDW